MKHTESMAVNKVENQNIPVLLMRRVYEDDVNGAKSLLAGIDEQTRR